MSFDNHPSRESTLRAQEAIVRSLTEELVHLDPASPAAAGLRTQLVEESGRLAFRLTATCAGQGQSEVPDAIPQPGFDGPKRPRVLIVEDDDGTRTALARWLGESYSVVTARDGEEGFALASESPPDVIVTDQWMPRLDGMSMVNRLKRVESTRAVPVIFLTGQAAAERIRAGISEGTIAYLPKPIDLDALEQALQVALTQSRPP